MTSLLTGTIVLAVAYLAIVAGLAIVAALRAGGRREDRPDDHEAVAASRFTIPVSVIVPLSRNLSSIDRSLSALLDLSYPELEVIVVGDGLTQAAIDALGREWQLEAREFFYRKTIETANVRRIYRSGRDPRLMVIDKAPRGYSDAINCGVNMARYRYVMPIGPDVMFDRDALLRLMAAPLRDPARVVGASHHVEHGDLTDNVGDALQGVPIATSTALSSLFQRLASARSLMDSRLAWRTLTAGLGPTGAVAAWRRDAVIKLNGFSGNAADADLDMMFRLQTLGAEGGGRFERGMEVFGRVVPQSMRSVLSTAARRQRAALEVLAACLRGRARAFDARTLAYFIGSEVVTPLAQAWIVAATVVGAAGGWFSWTAFILAMTLLSFGNAAVSMAALLLRGSTAGAPGDPELTRLIAAAPLEFVAYRPAPALARIAALFTTPYSSIENR